MGQKLNIAQILIGLASNCDGARSRDGRGFSRSHAHDGARLAAMARQGLAWSEADLKTAVSLIGCYSVQAGKMFSPNPDKAQRLSALFRSGHLEPGVEVTDRESVSPYMVMSEDRSMVHLYLNGSVEKFEKLVSLLHGLRKLTHGERRIISNLEKKREHHVNGRSRKSRRWEISLNNTTRPVLKHMAAEFSIAIDPGILHVTDEEYDRLIRHKYAAYLQKRGSGEDSKWFVVFDVAECNKAFLAEIKSRFKGRYESEEAGSGNWLWAIPLKKTVFGEIEGVIDEFQFVIDSRLKDFLEKSRFRHAGSKIR